MLAILLIILANVCAFWFGWNSRSHRHARDVGSLERQNAMLLATLRKLADDNQRLASWSDRFRDMYLEAVKRIDPKFAADLRRRWAAVQAPEAVQRMMQRARHG